MGERGYRQSTKRPQASAALLCAMLLSVAGCVGSIEDGPARSRGAGPGPGPDPRDPPPSSCEPGTIHAMPAALATLTPEQYVATLRDLVGAPDLELSVTDTSTLTGPSVEQLITAATTAVEQRASWTREVIPCDTRGAADLACVDSFMDGFAARAFRRPLTDPERTALRDAFDDAMDGLSFADAMEVLVTIVLASPQVVHRHELGVEDPSLPAGVVRLSDYELATRLSYALWGTMPDDALLAAASAGALHAPEELEIQVDRMLDSERGREGMHAFLAHWLELEGGTVPSIDDAMKDPELYPFDSPALRRDMRRELEAFVDWSLEDDGGSLRTLFTSRRAYVNGPMAALYGVPHAGPDSAWEWVELPEGQRAGILTRAAFLTVFSPATVDSPIRRGAFVFRHMLCRPLGAPPGDIDDTPPTGGMRPDGTVLSVREDVIERTSAEGRCLGCHETIINPIGFTFAHYDAMGAFRDLDIPSGRAIDSSSSILGTATHDGAVADAVELSDRFADDAQPASCLADTWVRRIFGETVTLPPCLRDDLRSRAIASGNVRDIVVSVVTSDAFRYLDVSASEEEVSR